MVDVFIILSLIYPEIISTIVFVAASWFSFQFSQRTRSRGFYLIFLGIFTKLVVDSVANLIYYSFWVPFTLHPSDLSANLPLLSLVALTSLAMKTVSLVVMFWLILNGALMITKEYLSAVTGPRSFA